MPEFCKHRDHSPCWSLLGTARVNDHDVCKIQAFRSGNRIPGDAVELIDETAAELRHFGEGMVFTTGILDERGGSDIDNHLAWLIAPLVRVLRSGQLGDELVKRCMTVANAGTIAEYCVESHRVT